MLWAAAVALLMSTQFLFQPFVWRNYLLDEVLSGWLTVARDRLVVGLMIALALVPVVLKAPQDRRLRLACYGLAVIAGAAGGEMILSKFNPLEDRQDVASLVGRITRWTLVGGAIAAMLYLWRSSAQLEATAAEAQIQEARVRSVAAASQLEVLRRQIEPHFLFNTLATIRRLQETEPEQGQDLLGRLFHYMSATLGASSSHRSTIGDEVALVQAYLEVCASRLNGRLTIRTDVAADLAGLEFPPLILATLAENAIKHGVFPKNGGAIDIRATRVGSGLEVALIDDGVGFSGEGGSGLGLANIAERLRLIYGPQATLRLTANTPSGVCATVRLPSLAPRR